MSGERKTDSNGLNGSLKYVAGAVAAIVAIASPFIAVGGAKEKISNNERDIASVRSEIAQHEKSDADKSEIIAGELGSMKASIEAQTAAVNKLENSISRMWQSKTPVKGYILSDEHNERTVT